MSDKYSFSVNKTLEIKSWDSGMENLSHRQAEDVIGSKIRDVFPSLHDRLSPVFNSGRKSQMKNFRNTCFLCTDFCADIKMVPVKDSKGNIKEVRVTLSNISGQCPLEKRLADSRKMVAIGKAASSLAHGVRNPLNAIKGAVVYLREKYGHESTLQEFSTIIYDEINKLDSFISGFLSTAHGDVKFAPVDVNDILKSILTMIKPRTETQCVRISSSFSVLPIISVDSFQIEQVVFNIVNNALEAMPDGGIINVKSSLKWEGGNDYVVIEISDTGKGISEKQLLKLGELSDNPQRNDKGFGIFLSREIIKSHNGKLIWGSVRHRGATFKIYLPVINENRPE